MTIEWQPENAEGSLWSATALPLGWQDSPACCDRAPTRLPLRAPLQCAGIPCKVESTNADDRPSVMKYVVPPIVIPVLLFIGIVAYGMLRPPIIVGHPSAPATNSLAR